jgi:ribosomal protein L18E
MLLPMLVQYVVGLCALRNNPNAVDVTVGDLVLDTAARKRRDVDVTVTLKEEDGSTRAFMAYEVKREGKPLDVATVEQLCAKLRDMPDITHRAIVSATNFTEGAINKVTAYNVELFTLKLWTAPIAEQFPDFPNIGRPEVPSLRR